MVTIPKNKVAAFPKELQKEIRDELRMAAAMRCYSIMRSGSAKSLQSQYRTMSNLFHGDEPSIVSNLKMLCSGSYVYRDFYESLDEQNVTSRSSQSNVENHQPKLYLKSELTRDYSRTYFANKHIIRSDLEKRTRNGKQLVSGRSILETAKKGTAYYRKALSFACKKFDLDKMTVIESGNTIQDVIEYVRVEMYQIVCKEEISRKKSIVIEDDIEIVNDVDDELEDNYLESLKTSKENEKEGATTTTSSSTSSSNVSSKHDASTKTNLDLTNDKSNTNDKHETSKQNKTNTNKDKNIQEKLSPPEDWFFPSWMSFIAYGPFVDKSKRLSLLEISDASKDIVKSRAQKRKSDKLEKNLKRTSDDSANRGFSTDQKLQLEIIDINRQQTNDRSRESVLMGLCIQEHALTKQIDRAERMAERRAPDSMDAPENKWWNKVDMLIKEQESVITQIAQINNNAMKSQKEGNKKIETSNNNQKSTLPTDLSSDSLLKASCQLEVLSSFSKDSDCKNSSNKNNKK